MSPFARSLMAVVAVALASLAGGALRADVLTLANGDKLKGKLVSNADGVIKFKSDILGEMVVPADKASVQVDPPAGAAAAPATLAVPAAASGTTAQVAAPKAKPKPKRKIRLTPFPTLLDPRASANDPGNGTKVDDTGWFNTINFGLTSQSGRTHSLNFDLRTENDFRTTRTDTRLTNRYLYGRTEGVTSANAISSNLRFRRTLTNRFFLQTNTRFDRNTVTFMRCDAEQGLGLGVNLKRTSSLVLAIGSEAAVRYRSFWPGNPNPPAEQSNPSCVLNVFQDMTLNFNPRFSFTQNFLALVAPTNDNDYRLNFNAGVTGKVTDTFRITTRIELEYDRSLAPELRYNQRITTSLGFVF